MWRLRFETICSGILISSLLGACDGIPQATTSATPSPTPPVAVIPWETKIDVLREYILQQPDQYAKRGFGNGPSLQKTFADGECLQVRFYNWDCNHDILYKMRGVVTWLDNINIRNIDPIWDSFRYYQYGYYADPDNGWNFYAESRLSFGACGNRGPQSSCGVYWCKEKDGSTTTPPKVPEGQTPYLDPNDRNNICPWLRNNGTAG